MRLIRPRAVNHGRRWALAFSLGMLLVGMVAVLLMALLPPGGRQPAIAALGMSAALGTGVGLAWLFRAVGEGRRRAGEDLARMLAPAFDDAYALVIGPRLPGVPDDLAALLIGPPGVRAIITRRWRGRYRVRGRAWEYDTKGGAGWIGCRTNPSFEADAVAEAVAAWARGATDDPAAFITPLVAFPQPSSVIVLEEPGSEVVTTDNAPWFAQRIGRVQRMDAARVGRFVQAVMDAADATALHERHAAAARS